MSTRQIKTTLAHRGYSLVKMSYPLFALAFLDLFSSSNWFDCDISWLGLPLILAILVASHIFLLYLQTDRAARVFYWLHRGKPPAIYLDWLEINETDNPVDTSIRLGLRNFKLSYVDELHLTIWGNLVFKSRLMTGSKIENGKQAVDADDVFKVPFGVISSSEQKQFIELVKSVRPDVVLGKRLEKKLSAKLVKGEDYIQALGAAFLLFVLFDLSHSMGGYLEMLKHYHLAQVVAREEMPSQAVREEKLKKATDQFERAEKMLDSPAGISLVKRTVLHKGVATAAVYQARADALWYLGKREEAIESLNTALEFYPKSLRMHLQLARWQIAVGKTREARKVISKMIEEHDDVLLPRLYMMVLTRQTSDDTRAKRYYEIYADQLDLQVFGDEPWWPPGGNRLLKDSWTRDDMHFVLDPMMLKGK
ncbi:MAG: tetratricopeptide repeat protein [Candidatus Melainabacteria bacterium]|nr:tetratricopeptide repeat protein [Candidatus Melainabacteria bacterium]